MFNICRHKANTNSSFCVDQLVSICDDFFVAGAETTSTTLTWAMLYMVRYPEIQRKVQRELDMIVGVDRMPTMQDNASLPYTEVVKTY